jgi:hypothetical protein
MGLAMIELMVSHQDIQDNPPNPLVMKIIVLTWLVDGNLFSTRIFILNIIGRYNHHKIPLIHEGRRDIWLERRIFISFHWPKEINSKRGQAKGSLELKTLFLVGVWSVVCVVEGTNWICVNVFMSTMMCVNKSRMEEY